MYVACITYCETRNSPAYVDRAIVNTQLSRKLQERTKVLPSPIFCYISSGLGTGGTKGARVLQPFPATTGIPPFIVKLPILSQKRAHFVVKAPYPIVKMPPDSLKSKIISLFSLCLSSTFQNSPSLQHIRTPQESMH